MLVTSVTTFCVLVVLCMNSMVKRPFTALLKMSIEIIFAMEKTFQKRDFFLFTLTKPYLPKGLDSGWPLTYLHCIEGYIHPYSLDRRKVTAYSIY